MEGERQAIPAHHLTRRSVEGTQGEGSSVADRCLSPAQLRTAATPTVEPEVAWPANSAQLRWVPVGAPRLTNTLSFPGDFTIPPSTAARARRSGGLLETGQAAPLRQDHFPFDPRQGTTSEAAAWVRWTGPGRGVSWVCCPTGKLSKRIKIEPLRTGASRPGVISYGVTSYGYDVRVGRHFKVFTNARCAVVDPKNFDPASFVDIEGDFCLIPPNSFALAETVEYLEIPRDVIAICVGKSTYARCGIIVNVTPLEPEWRGQVTIEISNTTPLPAKIYAGEGIAQILFLGRGGLPHQLRGQEGQVPGPEGPDPALRHRIEPPEVTPACRASDACSHGRVRGAGMSAFPARDARYADSSSLHRRGAGPLRRLPVRAAHLADRQPGRLGRLRDEGPAGAGGLVAGGGGHPGAEVLPQGRACPRRPSACAEAGVPDWLQRSRPAAGDPCTGQETDARQVFRRLAGCWTYWGWKGGYFSSRGRRPRLLRRDLLHAGGPDGRPQLPQWFNTGLHWAYGIEGPPQGHYYVDPAHEPGDAVHLGL